MLKNKLNISRKFALNASLSVVLAFEVAVIYHYGFDDIFSSYSASRLRNEAMANGVERARTSPMIKLPLPDSMVFAYRS